MRLRQCHRKAYFRRYTHPTPKLPDIETFQATLLQALDSPEMQKAAVSGLIDAIIVHPTAALEIQCSFQTFFETIALRGIDLKPSYRDSYSSSFLPRAVSIANQFL